MEQFILVPASFYNKSLITQLVRRRGIQKYQPLQNPAHQNDSLKKEVNKTMVARADTLVDKDLCCPPIRLSKSQTSKIDVVQTDVLLSDSAQQLQKRWRSRILLQFTWRCWYFPNSEFKPNCQNQR